MKLKNVFLILLIFIPFMSMSQNMNISGNVHDTLVDQPLPNALATLIRIKDSVLLGFQRTGKDGNFAFKDLKLDTLQLIISHPKFGEREYYFFGRPDNASFELKRIFLPQKTEQIDEITIFAYKDPIYYKGDTLVYVADSFATKPNAVVEDLLKKLPGISVDKDGKIKSQGKEISQVLVDGDEFFGADPTMATRNLAAKGVESVQVYEKKREDATEGDEMIQVMDLKLKDEAKKGYFGKASFASDFRKFYEGELLANNFNKKQKISAFVLTSNTMKSSLDWSDAYKYGLDNQTGYQYNSETDGWESDGSRNNGVGIPTTFKSGVYYVDQVSKKLKIGANYANTFNALETVESNRSQYFLSDTTYFSTQEKVNRSKNESHELNLSIKYDIDSLTTLEILPKLKINKASSVNNDQTDFIAEDNGLTRQTNVNNTNDAEGLNFKTRVGLTRKFKKEKRELKINNNFVYDKNTSEGTLYTKNSNFGNPLLSDTTDQKKSGNASIISNIFDITYVEPLTKKFRLEMEYELFNTVNDQERKTFNAINGQYTELDSNYSNIFTTKKIQNRIGTSLIYEYKKHFLVTGIYVRNVQIENSNEISLNTINQNVNSILPRVRYRYKISQNKRLQFGYNTSSRQPSINQLQPVNDNSNPNRLVLGNPDLLPSYTHRTNVSYNSYKPISGTYFGASLNNNITQNDFSTSVFYDAQGRSVTQSINTSGNTSSNFYFWAGLPIYKQVLKLESSLDLGYYQYKNYINNQENTTLSKYTRAGLAINLEKDSLEISLGGDLSYTLPSSKINSAQNQAYLTQTYNANFRWTLPYKFGIESDASYVINSKRTEGYNINYLIWNACVTRAFGKIDSWILGVTVNDILNQNINTNRNVSAVVTTDSKTNIIARYFMVKLTYLFNSTKTKQQDDSHF
ncbi:MAG: TonB-dependent receptor [Crocinitomicaceae bacterium]|nr:TonB-dependent receptor [Crocinitomicaceae bacterium]